MNNNSRKISFSRGVLTATAKHFNISVTGVQKRIFESFHLPTIEYALKENIRILEEQKKKQAEKEIAKNKIYELIQDENV